MTELIGIRRDDAILHIELCRPAARNALSTALLDELCGAVVEAGANRAVHVIILSGAGPVFCSGLDLDEVNGALASGGAFDCSLLARTLHALASVLKPTVAAVQGAASAGGAALVCACDFAVVAEDAVVTLPGAKRGLIAPILVPYVARALGPRVGLELILTGREMTATEAGRLGLATLVVPAARLMATAVEFAQSLARLDPIVVRDYKRAMTSVTGLATATRVSVAELSRIRGVNSASGRSLGSLSGAQE